MRLGYFADGLWSHRALDKIIQDPNLSVDFVCARFDKPDQQLRNNAEAAGIPFFVHEDVNSSDFEKTLSQFKSEIFVSMSFNQIFKQSIIQIPEKGIINCHAGMGPFYRGNRLLPRRFSIFERWPR